MNGKGIHITSKVLGGIFALFLLCVIASHDKHIQQKISSAIAGRIEGVIDGKISFSSILISPYGAFILKDVLVSDPTPYTADSYGKGYATTDTLFYARSITASFSLKGLFVHEGLHLGRVRIEDGGLFIVNEPEEERGRRNNMAILFKPKQIDSNFVASPGPSIFDIRRVNIKDFRFRLINFNEPQNQNKKPYSGVGINFEDMDVLVGLRAHNIKFAGGRMGGTVDHLEAREKSGYEILDLSADAISGLGKSEVSDLHLKDSESEVRLKYLNLSFKNITYFQDFVNRVCIDAEFRKSHVAISSVNYFSGGSLSGNGLVFDISGGHVHGTVNELDVRSLVFTESTTEVSGTASARVGNVVPDVSNLMLDAKVEGCCFTTGQMSDFLTNWAVRSGNKVDLGKLAPHETLMADLFCKGNIDDLEVGALLGGGSFGHLNFSGKIREAYSKRSPIAVAGRFSTDSLHTGRAAGIDRIGEMDSRGAFSAVLGKPLDFSLDSLIISRLDAIDYTFHNLDLRCKLENNSASAQLSSLDSALQASMVGMLDLKAWKGSRRFQFGATLDNVDLKKLGLDDRGEASSLKAVILANMVEDGEFIIGDAFVDKLNVDFGNGPAEVGDIVLRTFQRGEEQLMRLESPFIDLDFSSSGPLPDFLNDISDLTVRKYLPSVAGKSPVRDSCANYTLSADFHDTRNIMAYVLPGLYVSDSTTLIVSADEGIIAAELRSPRLASGSRFVRNLSLKMYNDSTSSLCTRVTMDELNTGGADIFNPLITASAASDSVRLNFNFDNINGSDSYGSFHIDTRFSRDEHGILEIEARPLGSIFSTGSQVWTISDSPVRIKGKDFQIDNMSIANGFQSFHVDGGLSPDKADTLGISLNQLDLSLIDYFLTEPLGVRGITTGQAFIASPTKTKLGMIVNIDCDSLSVGETEAGTFKISSRWDEADKTIHASIKNTCGGTDVLSADADYKPDDGGLGASVNFDRFPLAVAAPLLKNIFSEAGGYINGSLTASRKGKQDLSVISRDLKLDDARLRLGATGVSYTLNGPIKVDDTGIRLERMDIRDESDGRGSLSASIGHTKLSKLTLDASASLNGLDVIDISGNKGLTGHIKASGGLKVKGPLKQLTVDADLVTSNNGEIHIPLSGALSSEKSDLLVFEEPYREVDPYDKMLDEQARTEEKVKSDFMARGRVRLTPGINAFMEINKTSGNIITISGDGDVNVEMRPLKNQFNLDGIYMINKGNYHFVLPGILEKDFNIQNGSFVKFGGDIGDTEIDISAIYETRTSLATLIADSTVVGTRRLVECGLNISGKLSNPQIDFSVNVPDLDPKTKSQIDGALNTEDKIQKQFVALLLFGSFLPSEQSGVFNQSNILYSNIGEVVSSQINSIFQKLDIPVDIGLGYQETNSGTNAFDVAVSTQLFNNRVVVNGSVGNRRYSTGRTATNGDIVGDIDIEFKLDKEGKFRLNAFSHSADQFTSYLDNSQRNGLGASYQQEYNTFREFWRNLFKKRSRNTEESAVEEAPAEEVGNVTIKIENDSRKTISDSLDVR